MTKLRPIKDETELAKVPLDEPVLVELEPATTGALDAAGGDDPADKGDSAEERQDDGADALRKQLEASKEAERRANDLAATREREAREARAETERLKAQGSDTEKELLTNSLASAQAEEAAAKAEFEKAFEAGDGKAMADAQGKIGRAAARVLHFEGAVADLDAQAKEERERPKTEEPTDIVTAIDRDPNLMPKERDWLKDHPEVLTDARRNRELSVGYDRALAKGFKRGTEGYFKFLDEFMGFAQAAAASDDDETNTAEGSSIVSAPVTRDNRSSLSGRPQTPTRIQLTPQQRQLARDMGLSDADYARGIVQMESAKKADPEKFARR